MGTLEIQLPTDFKKRCKDYIAIYTGTERRKSLTPSERQVNREIWWALDKIYREALRQEKGKPFEIVFQARPIMGAGIPPIEIRQKMLLKVQELGGIKIIDDKTYDDTYGVDFVYTLELIQPKFDELYEKYQELNQEPSIEKPEQETASTTEQIKERIAGELNLNGYSEDNQRRFSKIIAIISNQIELDGWSRLLCLVKIPFATLEREGFNHEEMGSVFGSINKVNNKKIISVLNERPYKAIQKRPTYLFDFDDDITKRADEINRKEALWKWLSVEGRVMNVSEDDLKNKLVLELAIGGKQDAVVGMLSSWRKSIESKLNPVQTIPPNTNNTIRSEEPPKGLKSIHLITDSLEPKNAIFLVLDKLFEMPIRCEIKNAEGKPTYIKKLYDIAYIVNAPNKKVDYDRNIADSINNGLFRKKTVAKYMKTNKFQKPTLVKKSKDGILVLNSEDVSVKTGLVKNDVPIQHQSRYIDKTM